MVFVYCTVYGGSEEDAVDDLEVEDSALGRDSVAGPQTSVEHRSLSCLRLQEESAKKPKMKR